MQIGKYQEEVKANVVSLLTMSPNVTLLHTFKSKQLIDDWDKAFHIDISSDFSSEEEVYLFKCQETGLAFFYPYHIAGSAILYEQLQKFDWFYMPEKWEYLVALKDLNGCEKVLEVGAATGHFIRQGVKQGLDMKGIELNEKAVKQAKKKGLAVECMSLDDVLKEGEGSFDAVCSFQVLEHIAEPRLFIEQCIKSVRVGGTIIFSVPNAESFLKYQYNLLDMPPHHMTRWTEGVFKSLELLFPVQLESVVLEPLADYHTVGYLNTHSIHLREVKWYGKLLFNRISLPLLKKIISIPWFRQKLTGQSLYVRFKRLS